MHIDICICISIHVSAERQIGGKIGVSEAGLSDRRSRKRSVVFTMYEYLNVCIYAYVCIYIYIYIYETLVPFARRASTCFKEMRLRGEQARSERMIIIIIVIEKRK